MTETEASKAARLFHFEKPENNIFKTSNLSVLGQGSPQNAYGGIVMSQALAAAEQTVSNEFKPHSVHSYFILNVDTTIPVEYRVRILRDGRSFATRSVEAFQDGKAVFCLQASFHKLEQDSCVHQSPYPSGIPSAEECSSITFTYADAIAVLNSGDIQGDEHKRDATEESKEQWTKWFFDYRLTDISALYGTAKVPQKFFFWIKPKVPLPVDERLYRWLILFASDAFPACSVIAPHAMNNFSVSMVATLDHTMHFHTHDIPLEEWLLFEIESIAAGGARGFAVGRLWSTGGRLLASFSQELIIRTMGPASKL